MTLVGGFWTVAGMERWCWFRDGFMDFIGFGACVLGGMDRG